MVPGGTAGRDLTSATAGLLGTPPSRRSGWYPLDA